MYDDPDGGEWIAPSDYDARWDGEDYVDSPTDELPIIKRPSVNGRHGFVLHDECWCLL